MRRLWTDIVAPAMEPIMDMTRQGMRVDEARRVQLLERAETQRDELSETVLEFATPYTSAAQPRRPEPAPCEEHPEFRGETARKKCPRCREIWEEVRQWRTSKVVTKAKQLANFNPRSGPHRSWLLFERLGLPVLERTPGGAPRTTLGVIEGLIEHRKTPDEVLPLLRALEQLAHVHKRISVDLVPPVGADGKVHPNYTLEGTAIGRVRSGMEKFDIDKMSLEAYNAQNVPPEVRSIYVADPGYMLLELDAKQIEWVLMMLLAKCGRAVKAYAEGHDVHTWNAANCVVPELFEEVWDELDAKAKKGRRRDTKTFTHGVDYGEGVFNLARRFGVTTARATRTRDRYLMEWKEIALWQEEVHRVALETRVLRNPFGRQRRFLDVTAKVADGQKRLLLNTKAYKEALAFGPASTNADIWKVNLRSLYDAKLVQVTGTHDSHLLQVPEDDVLMMAELAQIICEQEIPELAEYNGGSAWSPRYEVKVGRNWGDWGEENPEGMEAMERWEARQVR